MCVCVCVCVCVSVFYGKHQHAPFRGSNKQTMKTTNSPQDRTRAWGDRTDSGDNTQNAGDLLSVHWVLATKVIRGRARQNFTDHR